MRHAGRSSAVPPNPDPLQREWVEPSPPHAPPTSNSMLSLWGSFPAAPVCQGAWALKGVSLQPTAVGRAGHVWGGREDVGVNTVNFRDTPCAGER